jgi:hypothetical protein
LCIFFLCLETKKETKKIQAGNDNSPFPALFLDFALCYCGLRICYYKVEGCWFFTSRHPEFILESLGVLEHVLPGDAETGSA